MCFCPATSNDGGPRTNGGRTVRRSKSCAELRESSRWTSSSRSAGAARCGCATSSPTAVRTKRACTATPTPLWPTAASASSILSSGQQPLSNEDGRIWVIFNGEIYNHAEVRRELESHGHAYRTKSDTETIVHAYEQWGEDCVHRFRGMFAFAIWDAPRRRLLLVRDRLGIKPLYWTRTPDALLFGSEIKAILASGLIEPAPTRRSLPEVLSTRYTSGTETMFEGIHKLLPGHLLVFEGGQITHAAVLGRAGRETANAEATASHPTRRALQGAARRIRQAASDGRRAARDVPVGRHRQQRDRRADGEDDRPSAADVLGRLQGSRVQRARVRARSGEGDRRRCRTKSSSTIATSSARCRNWCGTRTNRSRILRASRSISFRRWPVNTSPWSSPARAATNCWPATASIRASPGTGAPAPCTSG